MNRALPYYHAVAALRHFRGQNSQLKSDDWFGRDRLRKSEGLG
jgi:hypothetical protein